jgi:iron complex outermembrane receptor protein
MRIPTFSIFSAPVKPELADQTEVGVKLNNLNGITATIALFDLKLKNAVVADPVNFGKSIQIGSESSRGLDVDVQWQLSPAWRMLASLNHQTPKNDDTGKQMLNVPKTSARLASHYQFSSRSIVPGLGVGVGLTHHSALPGDAANTFFTPSATVYDVQLSYALGQARIGLSATNISDKQYYVPTRYFGGGQVLPAPGRAISATLRYTF